VIQKRITGAGGPAKHPTAQSWLLKVTGTATTRFTLWIFWSRKVI